MSKQDFDVYLARASNLSQRYRDEATDKPSQALDSLILTASRRAPVNSVKAEPVSWFKRWRVPLSIAVVMMLSVGVTLRVVMQEAKQSSPAGYALPKEESAAPPATAKPAQPPAEAAAGAVSGGAPASSAVDPPPVPADVTKKNDQDMEQEKEIAIDEPMSNAFPAAPPSVLKDKAAAPMPSPAPSSSAAPSQDALESQSGSGSSSNDLEKRRSAPRAEQDSSMAEVPSSPAKRDDDVLSRQREQAAPEAKQSEMRAAPAQAFPSEGPRLPEGHYPVVDGKTYRAEKAKADEAAEKKVTGSDAIIDNIEDAPEAWLRRVAELRRLGRNDEANAELERFRKRYPDYNAPVER